MSAEQHSLRCINCGATFDCYCKEPQGLHWCDKCSFELEGYSIARLTEGGEKAK